jgi:hypothetical protein
VADHGDGRLQAGDEGAQAVPEGRAPAQVAQDVTGGGVGGLGEGTPAALYGA